MRKLASVQVITKLDPIPNADKIEVATILGWQVVVQKEQFKVGDKVVYVEVDSIMPEKPEYEFLRERKFRVRTIKLKGQVSQGIVFPLSVIGTKNYERTPEGTDVTEALGIRYYDPQGDIERKLAEEQANRQKSKVKRFLSRYGWFRKLFVRRQGFPAFIKKTDEDRVQLFPNICETHKDVVFDVTEKLDGQSATYFLVKKRGLFRTTYEFGVCSRNLLLPKADNSTYWRIAKQYKIEDSLREIIGDEDYVVLQGEIVGPGVQGNKYGFGENRFYVFNLIYPKQGRLSYRDMCSKISYQLILVPFLFSTYLPENIPQIVEWSRGVSVKANIPREGIVCRSGNMSFKVINPDFLLKYGE